MQSWRAYIRQYISDGFNQKYDLERPWSTPANQHVVNIGARLFCCPNNQEEPNRFTNYVAVIDHGVSTFDQANQIPKGSPEEAKQVLVIEYPNSDILWTEPRDLDVTELHKLAEGNDPLGLGVLFADGSFRRMKRAEVLKLFGR